MEPTIVSRVLSGHYSAETAYLVADYPYGFRLRCQIRYWLEVGPKGTRLWSQTTNPKRGDVWNPAKKSTYSTLGAMFLDEKGHVHWHGLSPYDSSKARAYLDTYRDGLTPRQVAFCEKLANAYEARQAELKVRTSQVEPGIVATVIGF